MAVNSPMLLEGERGPERSDTLSKNDREISQLYRSAGGRGRCQPGRRGDCRGGGRRCRSSPAFYTAVSSSAFLGPQERGPLPIRSSPPTP